MYAKTITLRPDAPNFPLDPVWVGQGSCAKIILAAVPAAATSVKAVIYPVDGSPALSYEGALNETSGLWEVYIPAWNFPTAGATTYEINVYTASTTEGETLTWWAGAGILTVKAANTADDIPTASYIPDGKYWWDPIQKLYFKLTLVKDPDTNRMTIDVGQEGVSHVP